jgi:predicted negative regulator of RcsB-dependent stress response
MQEAVVMAAVPHWFDSLYLKALLEEYSNDLYAELVTLSFVEQVPGKGYAIHDRTRRQLLHNLWQADPAHFRTLSGRAADYCAIRTQDNDDPEWEAEVIYHRLVSDPDVGVAGLRGLATKWANYEYHSYDEIERALRWANEQMAAGRLTAVSADWTRLWQAKLALIYNRFEMAAAPLNQITTADDPYLAAEAAQTRGDLLAQTKDQARMTAAWQRAYQLYRQLPDRQGRLDAYLVVEKMRQHGLPEPEDATEIETRPKRTPSRNALQLIDNIHTAWSEGVLNITLAETSCCNKRDWMQICPYHCFSTSLLLGCLRKKKEVIFSIG